MSKQSLIELLKNTAAGWLAPSNIEPPVEILGHEFSLYHIKQVTFDEDSPRKEAFENVLNALAIEGVIFTYLLLGNKKQVNFYFGIAKNKRHRGSLSLEVDDIGEMILKPSLEGNFRGSVVEKLEKIQRNEVKDIIGSFTHISKLEGVPNVHEDNEQFQGVDRLVDIMSGDEFCLAVLADPLSLLEINKIESELHNIYDKLMPLAKKSIQSGENESKSIGEAEGKTVTDSTGTNDNLSITQNTGKSVSVTSGTSDSGSSKQTSKSAAETDHDKYRSGSEATSKGTTVSKAIAINTGSNTSTQSGTSSSESRDFTDKSIQEWLNYIDEVLLKRVQLGKNKGLYLSNIYLLANSVASVLKLGNTARSIFSGAETNKSPLQIRKVTDNHEINSVRNFQLPILKIREAEQTKITSSESQLALLLSKSPFNRYACNWLSTKELSVVAGLPQKEVVGLTLKEEVEFGLNVNAQIDDQNRLFLGNLVKSGLPQTIEVFMDKRELDKHIFIAGVTGSGKTTTCHRLLESAQIPFLVIEPAKTEYRVLTKKNKDILIFTLGNDNVAPFRLNPFEFFPHENITSRVDMIKASIEAAFDMEAAIPQLIEAAIYRCYEEKGWNIATSKNRLYADPFADGIYAFPTLSDLIAMTEVVVSDQGFDDRLKQDYIGSIKARLQGLLIGAKGLMLDTPRSINFTDLVQRNVILELEEIRNPSEKSLIMGFVLANLNEAIRASYKQYQQRGEKFRHITLIEEAHRLLTKFEVGDSPNKKQGVETFADMLAEVRKYGESLIIIDQIPNKLTPEVLKNTSTKIIHKLFAQDDKEAVGNTMALSDEQKDFLSNLEPGRVILSSSGMSKPLQVQIEELLSTTTEQDVDPTEIRQIALQYYADAYSTGLIQGLEWLSSKPSADDVSDFLQGAVAESWYVAVGKSKDRIDLLEYLNKFGWQFMYQYICLTCYQQSDSSDRLIREKSVHDFLCKLNSHHQERICINLNDVFRKDLKVKY
ncbi:ATP-binding protein [Vibrio metschnikovii]|uniref:ATP-binding protein n=1 Tax=Vibrio TaxID=662 RepID=UPI001482BA1C|nr:MULTISPECIES: ATP-binding protein [Vibrio]EKO3685710.1 ATP-binding protein [Vibrio metschnikovii]EKO3689091.1 ATP-binding protein [Vibrio metschnikovii]MCG3728118.1 ATP-binding protein [Vibrio cincinnatiensis]NNN59700.1 ATP-binding protein [Vibrio sp. A11]